MLQVVPHLLPEVYEVLVAKGFHTTPLQHHWSGQQFGLVLDLSDGTQLHVRALISGVLESHHELSRFVWEHLSWPSENADEYTAQVLTAFSIPFEVIGFLQPSGPYAVPARRTDWRPAAAIGIGLGLAWFATRKLGRDAA